MCPSLPLLLCTWGIGSYSTRLSVHTPRKHDTMWKLFVRSRKPVLEEKWVQSNALFRYFLIYFKAPRCDRFILVAVLLLIRRVFSGLWGWEEWCIAQAEAINQVLCVKRSSGNGDPWWSKPSTSPAYQRQWRFYLLSQCWGYICHCPASLSMVTMLMQSADESCVMQ